MENKYLKGLIIVLEASFFIFLIWVLCAIFTTLLSYAIIFICNGECTNELFIEYMSYIRIGFGAVFGIALSWYLQKLNKKYKIL